MIFDVTRPSTFKQEIDRFSLFDNCFCFEFVDDDKVDLQKTRSKILLKLNDKSNIFFIFM